MDAEVNLTHLGDELLLMIFSYLKASDLLTLTKVCSGLERIALDQSLWRNTVDFRPACYTIQQMKKNCKFLNDRTNTLIMRGFVKAYKGLPRRQTESLSEALITDIAKKAVNLKGLLLFEHYVDVEKLRLSVMPSGLTELRLNHSEFVNMPGCTIGSEPYFKKISDFLPNLVTLDLTGCQWLDNHSLMALSKLPHLERLYLRYCFRIGQVFAYTALSIRCGFKALKVLDVRDTTVSSSEVTGFALIATLEELSVGNPKTPDKVKGIDFLSFRKERSPNLKVLCLRYCGVKDSTLEHLRKQFPDLLYLDVRNTEVTKDGVAQLRSEQCELTLLSDHDLSLLSDHNTQD